METALKHARTEFFVQQKRNQVTAMQRVALQVVAGIDLDEIVKATEEIKQRTRRRLLRLIERERLKGVRGHWSYDLNRHIALKQAFDRIC
ncbi:Mg/Co/Ni transporter MgtE [Ochrobactrum daejeonense]|uniref:Mg/Co/Ni transporter MgtE n=1 Tax=Brucella daejeonensis TaxID=659015 RepID=A0A7W9B0E1_9HYPH|nr:cytoplasmic protein [Brucella daejeonensis]MBB5703731.1 Mg/Co/Ni transporter MgtE [Brucella daejeonensis]NKB78754.1 cytoplasmic protein [Brucella daejeonensis]